MELEGTLAAILEDRLSVVAEEEEITIPSMESILMSPVRNGWFQGLNNTSKDESLMYVWVQIHTPSIGESISSFWPNKISSRHNHQLAH